MVRLFAIILALLIASPALGKQVKRVSSGIWQGGAYVSDQTGRFTSCIVSAKYRSGILMLVMINRDYLWDLGFSANRWNLRVGDSIRLKFRIDSGPWFNVSAKVYSKTGVRLPMQGQRNLVAQFRRGRTLELQDKSNSYYFNLTGTSRMMVRLVQCVKTQLAIEPSYTAPRVAQTQPARSKSKTAASSRTANTQSSNTRTANTQTTGNSYNDGQLVAEGTRVLANFIVGANLSNLNILAPASVPKALGFAHSVATASGQVVFVFIAPDEARLSRQSVIAALGSKVESGCNGDYLSGTSKRKMSGLAVSTGFAACDRSGEVTQVRYVVTPRGSGGIYLIGLISGQGGNWGGELDDQMSAQAAVDDEGLRQAAFKASR